jgi:hypothetical protein
MANARDLRLQSDYAGVLALVHASRGTLRIDEVKGRPPDAYTLTYRCRGIESLKAGKPVYRATHSVRIQLPARYPAPSAPPIVKMLTPIFHPHVYPNLEVCMGSWQTSEYLEDFVLRLGALIQYDRIYMNVRDPANEEAVDWARKNLILLPTDHCTFGSEALTPAPIVEPAPPILWQDLTDT